MICNLRLFPAQGKITVTTPGAVKVIYHKPPSLDWESYIHKTDDKVVQFSGFVYVLRQNSLFIR